MALQQDVLEVVQRRGEDEGRRVFQDFFMGLEAVEGHPEEGKDKDHQHQEKGAVKKNPPPPPSPTRLRRFPGHACPLRTEARTTFPARMTKKRTTRSELA